LKTTAVAKTAKLLEQLRLTINHACRFSLPYQRIPLL